MRASTSKRVSEGNPRFDDPAMPEVEQIADVAVFRLRHVSELYPFVVDCYPKSLMSNPPSCSW